MKVVFLAIMAVALAVIHPSLTLLVAAYLYWSAVRAERKAREREQRAIEAAFLRAQAPPESVGDARERRFRLISGGKS